MANSVKKGREPNKNLGKSSRAGADAQVGKRSLDLGLLSVYLLILLPPWIVFPSLIESFRLPKLIISEVLALMAVAFLAWRLRRLEALDFKAFVAKPWVKAALAIFLAAGLTLLTSEHQERVAKTLPSLAIALIFLVGSSLALTVAERQRAFTLLLCSGTLLAIVGLVQAFGVIMPFAVIAETDARLNLTSFAGGAFDLGAYLVLPCLIAQHFLAGEGTRRRKILVGSALLVCVLALSLTQTLSALLALGMASLFYWLFAFERRRRWQTMGALALVGALAILIVAPLRERIVSKSKEIARLEINAALSGRLDGWRAALWMVKEHPLTGVGHGAYRSEYGDAKLALIDQGVAFYRWHRGAFFVNAHNDLLEAVAEWGLIGLAAIAYALFQLRRSLTQGSLPQGSTSLGSSIPGAGSVRGFEWAGLIALATMALTNFPLHIALVAYPWLLFLGGIKGESRP